MLSLIRGEREEVLLFAKELEVFFKSRLGTLQSLDLGKANLSLAETKFLEKMAKKYDATIKLPNRSIPADKVTQG